ncbi:DUF732 domain-containing protein [Cryobacterium sp. 10S3]|uniref:DUF732 domain-containing protein n=1 Tax=Cryobacterium sp. 10S3 TaxID=3048582 RepID=UPI002AC9348A|nr:DUF732 domain-containing protein [Cryobacterium sp. 10S3]MEB0287215.1 DUF732 domain-containing protein [Cryobacterium sp. 10S3]WPX14170.1 DUF732 domain-containing protein [Cryobacterium sp. 10S3]
MSYNIPVAPSAPQQPKKRFRKRIALVVVLLIIGNIVLFNVLNPTKDTAPLAGTDAAYVTNVHQYSQGEDGSLTIAEIIALGHSVCSLLESGIKESQLILSLAVLNAHPHLAGAVMGSAEGAYCPTAVH